MFVLCVCCVGVFALFFGVFECFFFIVLDADVCLIVLFPVVCFVCCCLLVLVLFLLMICLFFVRSCILMLLFVDLFGFDIFLFCVINRCLCCLPHFVVLCV